MPSSTKPLDVFRDLHLRGPVAAIGLLRQALIGRAEPPWRHAPERERLLHLSGDDSKPLAFERSATAGFSSAGLVLFPSDDGLEVTNIVPREISELSHRAYNALLEDFADRVAQPAAEATGFTAELSGGTRQIEDKLSPGAAEALRRFSMLANKFTGASHPLDGQRWFDFLIRAHRDRCELDASFLRRWLMEADGWSEDHAVDLAIEYERARALLARLEETA